MHYLDCFDHRKTKVNPRGQYFIDNKIIAKIIKTI